MFRIFYAEQDATLFEGADSGSITSITNTGLDELLEIGKRLGTDGSTLLKSRSVITTSKPILNDLAYPLY